MGSALSVRLLPVSVRFAHVIFILDILLSINFMDFMKGKS